MDALRVVHVCCLKGGTSLSKAHGLINRFSEEIDITAFRKDLNQAASVEDLEALTGKKERQNSTPFVMPARFGCGVHLREGVGAQLAEFAPERSKVELDDTDPDGQTLLVLYPAITPADSDYIRPAVRIEYGAKSALDRHGETTIRPYIAEDTVELDISVPGVTTIEPVRSFWDKAVIAHGLRRWYEIRGELRQEGQRISRHYYDLHCLHNSSVGPIALADRNLAGDYVRNARLFFNHLDFDLASAQPGSWAIEPSPAMLDRLRLDYEKTSPMIFGAPPAFEEIMPSTKALNVAANQIRPRARQTQTNTLAPMSHY
jgi:hypothetical protein